jgi:hypothetical protein
MYVVIWNLNQSVSFISNSSGTYELDIFKKVDNEGLLYCYRGQDGSEIRTFLRKLASV